MLHQRLRRTLLLGAGAMALPVQADLVSIIAAAKTSVFPVGSFNPTDSPRFAFRGTGFVVGDGSLIATNFHVLPSAADVETLANMVVLVGRQGEQGLFRKCRVVATERARDLALLKLEGSPLTPLQLDEPGAAKEGQSIALMGFPIGGTLGFAAVTHRGIIASITTAALPAATAGQLDPRALLRLREGNFEVYQLDATAYPGNSGGPVLDVNTGRVVAVVNMVLVKAGRESALSNPTGISYAIPIRYVQELIKSLR